MKLTILIDRGHGSNTYGKRSPDGRLLEWAWADEVAIDLSDELVRRGYDTFLVTPEANDISLTERVRRVNEVCRRVGVKNCVLLSLHVNAAGMGTQWKSARGWTGWVAPKSSENSKRLAALLHDEAVKLGLEGNRSVPKDKYWTGDYAIVRDTLCPAVLTENLFMDNREDVEVLLSDAGKRDIVLLHANGIEEYYKGL